MNRVQQHLLASGKSVPVSRLCQWLGLPRSTAYYQPRERKARPVDEVLAARIKRIHQEEPACGLRGTWSRLRFVEGIRVNRKKVQSLLSHLLVSALLFFRCSECILDPFVLPFLPLGDLLFGGRGLAAFLLVNGNLTPFISSSFSTTIGKSLIQITSVLRNSLPSSPFGTF